MASKIVDESGAEVANRPRGNLVPVDMGAVITAAEALLNMIPDMPESDGSGIFAAILNAESWEDLSRQGSLPNGKDMIGVEQTIRDVFKMPSDLAPSEDGGGLKLSHFLIIDATTQKDHKPIRWQTSAGGLVLPITKLYTWGKLPAAVTVTTPEDTTRRGYKPLNLTVRAVS